MWLDLTHLALVGSLVSLLEEPDPKCPVVSVLGTDNTEARVPAVGVEAGGEDVVVASPDPRHLREGRKMTLYHTPWLYNDSRNTIPKITRLLFLVFHIFY